MSDHPEKRHRIQDLHLGIMDTPRARRAHRFANMVQATLRDFLPRDRKCAESIAEYLLELSYEGNFEIVAVPPECDAFTKLEIERRMIEVSAAGTLPRETVHNMLVALKSAKELLDDLEGEIDKQTYDDYQKAEYDMLDDAELHVVLTAGNERKLGKALQIIMDAIKKAEPI